ncbi:hypothetical protein HMPREF1870_01001 [Bacteroidales bacterium KA00344]|nr:hypothetical protein HMPREF1870_01001 [Bacteroidales bacterium KA00344]
MPFVSFAVIDNCYVFSLQTPLQNSRILKKLCSRPKNRKI